MADENIMSEELISIVTVCMNRNDNLLANIDSWLALSVNEILIVDWSSDERVDETLNSFDDDRIRIIRVVDEEKWVLTYAFNLALSKAKGSKIFKLDSDIQVSPDFLERNCFSKGEYVRGFWKNALDAGKKDQVFVNGSFGAYKADLKAIGYYNEYIRSYGWDDSDLYLRLGHSKLVPKYLCLESLVHIAQEQEERIKHQNLAMVKLYDHFESTDFYNRRNKYLSTLLPQWNKQRKRQKFKKLKKETPDVLRRVSKDLVIPDHYVRTANRYAAISYSYVKKPLNTLFKTKPQLADLVVKQFEENKSFKYVYWYLFLRLSLLKGHRRSGLKMFIKKFLGKTVKHSVLKTYKIPPASLNKESKLYIDAQHGLGNRLRAVASAAVVARKLGRKLVIVWVPDHHCECNFLDLFDYDGEVINTSSLGVAEDKNVDFYNYMDTEKDSIKGQKIEFSENDLYVRSAYVLNHPASVFDDENDFLKGLKVTKRVQCLIESLSHELSNCEFSLHIRMEGEGSYEQHYNWSEDGKQDLVNWRKKSHYSHFFKRIDRALAETPEAKFFLATDCKENYELVLERYGDRVIYLHREVFDRSALQIQYALADAILLSRSKQLFGSTWSSFTELSKRLAVADMSVEMSGVDF